MRFVTCIVRENQLRLYGHVARFPDADPAHQILSVREPRECRTPMGRPCASWLQQVDQHLKEKGMGQASGNGHYRMGGKHREYKMDITGTFRKETREFEGGGLGWIIVGRKDRGFGWDMTKLGG